MSRIDQLITELCPKGVPFKTLGEIGFFYGGLTGKAKSDFQDGNSKFITYMNVFSNIAINTEITDTVKVKSGEKQNCVKVGDILFTGSSETPDECGMSSVLTKQPPEKLYLNSFCFGFRLNHQNLLLPDFSKYLFRSNLLRKQIEKTASGVTRFNVSKQKMLKVRVPIPPLPIQEEIVRILDSFTVLEAELEAELEARKKQYEHYRDTLLNLGEPTGCRRLDRLIEELCPKGVPYKLISEIGTLMRGKRFVKADAVEDGIPCIHYGEIYTHYGIYTVETKSHVRPELGPKLRYASKNDVIIVGAGENDIDIGIGVALLGEEEVAVHDACYILKHDMNPKYISYFLRTENYHKQIKKYVSSGKICAISSEVMWGTKNGPLGLVEKGLSSSTF